MMKLVGWNHKLGLVGWNHILGNPEGERWMPSLKILVEKYLGGNIFLLAEIQLVQKELNNWLIQHSPTSSAIKLKDSSNAGLKKYLSIIIQFPQSYI